MPCATSCCSVWDSLIWCGVSLLALNCNCERWWVYPTRGALIGVCSYTALLSMVRTFAHLKTTPAFVVSLWTQEYRLLRERVSNWWLLCPRKIALGTSKPYPSIPREQTAQHTTLALLPSALIDLRGSHCFNGKGKMSGRVRTAVWVLI